MSHDVNALGQTIGFRVDGWTPPAPPPREAMDGRTCRLEPLDAARHCSGLHSANLLDTDHRNWTYLPYGPFARLDDYVDWVRNVAGKDDPQFHAIVDRAGHINYSPRLQRTVAATEAMYLMMRRAFGLGYRRYEWKCNALNAASRAAAQRLGLSYEGVFRQARVDKGRNRDTAWYAAIDREWPLLDQAFRRWLDPANFDEQGRQRTPLSELTAPILVSRG
ncbi:MAG: GNAT family N-acetyltransferase [Acidobacteria bacterium]|nr:MAG: GNAT family N-acetyltransferase [Acidobacteriota bacterium]